MVEATHDDAFLRSLGIIVPSEHHYRPLKDIECDHAALKKEPTARAMVLALDRIVQEHESYGSRFTNAAFHELLYHLYVKATSDNDERIATLVQLTNLSFIERVSHYPRGLVDPSFSAELVRKVEGK